MADALDSSSSMELDLEPFTSAVVVLRTCPDAVALPHVVASVSAFLDSPVSRSLSDAVKATDSAHLLKRVFARALGQSRQSTRRYPRFLTFHIHDAALGAAERGHLNALEALRNVNTRGVDREDVFATAASHGHAHVLEWMHTRGSYDIKRVLDVATYKIVTNGYTHVVEWFLHHWPTVDYSSVLASAVYRGVFAIVERLCAFVRADMATFAAGGAAARGDLAMIQWLDERARTRWLNAHPGNQWPSSRARLHWLNGRARIQFPASAIDDAARGGHLDVIEWLHAERELCPSVWASLHAATCGHLHVLQWLHSHFPSRLRVHTMDAAAAHGHLAVVQFLHAHCGIDCTPSVLDSAAMNGHVAILAYLYDRQRDARCSTSAMDVAAARGHLDVVEFLHAHQAPGFTTRTMDEAASNGHLATVAFLHENRSEGCTTRAMDHAAANGHLDVVRFLHERRTEGCTVGAMNMAAKHGHLDVVQWLHANRTEGCTSIAMDEAASHGHLAVVEWLHTHRTEGCSSAAIQVAIQNEHIRVAQWLFQHRNERAFTPVMTAAAERGHFAMLPFLHVMSTALESRTIQHPRATVAHYHWLYETLPEHCDIARVKRLAHEYGRSDVLEWLCEIGEM